MHRLLMCFSLLYCLNAIAEVPLPDRRKPQFLTETGYYVFPTPYSLPGLGEGILAVGALTNAYHNYSDIYAFAAAGDLEGVGLFFADNHLIEQTLVIDLSAQSFNKATQQVYQQRGMETEADDYILAELDAVDYQGGRLTYTAFERRLEIYTLMFSGEASLAALRDRDGNLIQAIDGEKERTEFTTYGLRLDLTDDYQDPRRGLRIESSLWHTPPKELDQPDFNIVELNLTGYIPIGIHDTLVLNYFMADTDVKRKGETDPVIVEDNLGLDCSSGSVEDQQDCLSFVNDAVASNTYGSVGALGGLSRLRSYPGGRFNGSHARFYGVEYRWNIVEETKPFDFFLAKDIRTVIQVAIFYERGTISDSRDTLWDSSRYSTGIGARLVTASGLIFRADIATGDEGEEVSIIVGYPWEVF